MAREGLAHTEASTPEEESARDAFRRQSARLEELLSTSSQLKNFRVAAGIDWSERFVPVENFRRDMSLFGHEGVKLVEHLWNSLPSCRFKRFQELFSDNAHYAIPRPNMKAPCVVYPPRSELHGIPLTSCMVNPAAIPFKLIVDLGIVAEPTRTLSDIEALEIKSSPRVIASLKAIFESAVALAPGNERVLLLRQIDATKYPEAQQLSEDKIGSIIYIRENTAVNRTGPKRDRTVWHAPEQVASYFPSVYSALRKTDHETSGYQLETMSLGQLSVEWNELTSRARQEWRRSASTEIKLTIRRDLEALVAKSREELSGVFHHLKREAADAFTDLEARLAQGSNNITTHITAADAAVRRLNKTMDGSARKTGYNTTDAKQLSTLIQGAEHGFKLIGDSLFRASARLNDEMKRSGGYFSQKDLPLSEREATTNTLLVRAGIPITAIDMVADRPLRAFAIRMREAYASLKSSVVDQDIPGTQRAIVRLVVLSKLQRANSAFEALRRLTVRSEAVPLRELTRTVASLKSLMDLRSVFPQTLVPEYKPTYSRIQRRVSTIANGLERYRAQGLDLTERRQMYSRLRAYLDETDLEAEVRALPEGEEMTPKD